MHTSAPWSVSALQETFPLVKMASKREELVFWLHPEFTVVSFPNVSTALFPHSNLTFFKKLFLVFLQSDWIIHHVVIPITARVQPKRLFSFVVLVAIDREIMLRFTCFLIFLLVLSILGKIVTKNFVALICGSIWSSFLWLNCFNLLIIADSAATCLMNIG